MRDHPNFEKGITFAILFVAIVTGYDTDLFMHCSRYDARRERYEAAGGEPLHDSWCGEMTLADVTTVLAQVVFTVEVVVKILAERYNPMQYFHDPDSGSWNTVSSCTVEGSDLR